MTKRERENRFYLPEALFPFLNNLVHFEGSFFFEIYHYFIIKKYQKIHVFPLTILWIHYMIFTNVTV